MRKTLLVAAVVLSTFGMVAGSIWGGLHGGDVLWPVTWMVWAPVGALILWRRPRNGVGLAMLLIGLGWGVSFLCLAIAYSSPAPLEVRIWVELVNAIFGIFPWIGIIWMLLVFPSGRLEGRLEKVSGAALAVLTAMACLAFVVSPEPLEATGRPSPLATEWLATPTLWFVDSGFILVLAVLVAAVVSLARRWMRSSGAERHQYRWLVLGALIFLVILALGQVLPENSKAMYLWVLAGASIPLAVGIAISRYRLFEIDRLLSRTVTYAVVAGLLGSLFALVVVGVPNWIPGVDDSPLLVAIATLGVAALFNPLRRRVQFAVERRFNRGRYDAELVMDAFASTLREEVDTRDIVEGWTGVVAETMQPVTVGVWVKEER